MHTTVVIACLLTLAGCARGALVSDGDGGAASSGTGAGEGGAAGGNGSASGGDGGQASGGDSAGDGGASSGNAQGSGGGEGGASANGDVNPVLDGGPPDAASPVCVDAPASCAVAELLGELDAADGASMFMKQGTGSGWFAVDLRDSNKDATGNSRIGIGVTLSAPAGSTYQVTLVGDTSPDGAGRCVKADVTDTTPLSKTAIWGSYGPTTGTNRTLAVHVEHLSGTCDAPWTLTVTGNPCPALTVGFGEDSLGSCP